MDANSFQNVTLKKVSPKDEPTGSSIQEAVQSEKELNRRLLQADMDSWYNTLKDYTYETVFLPLSVEEAEAMIEKYSKKKSSSPCSPEVENLLQDLEHRIAKVMTDFVGVQSVFTKLSSRSPKDATNRKAAKEQILLKLLEEKGTLPISKNDIISCVFQAHISSFKLNSAKEVLETLLSSERVVMDELPLALEHRHKIWKEHIVLRKWNDIPIQFELRGFVYNNTMTGLCQYYDEVVYPEVLANKEMITKLVLDFFNMIKDVVPIHPKEYVLDLVVDIHQQKVLIVEINPFGKPDGMGTGTVMFDLRNPVDIDILFGEREFEFRVETEPLSEEAYKNMIGSELDTLVCCYY